MNHRRRKPPREKDLTSRYFSGNMEEDRIEPNERFSARSKSAEQDKIERTTLMRAAEEAEKEGGGDVESLPTGQVLQVYSLFYNVGDGTTIRKAVLRKTLSKVLETPIVVGDRVRFRDIAGDEAVIEQLLPRRTLLTRADSFNARTVQPIVANADQMLIVVSPIQPKVKWGLVDRMLVAARAGGLGPIVCFNKTDLIADAEPYELVLRHYESLEIRVVRTSTVQKLGLEALRELLRDRTTVLSGHSGVGKSSLVNSLQPDLDLRIGAVSGYTDKGRHTTTTAVRYPLSFGGYVVDTPGVKLFGLWNVTAENLPEYFPDVAAGTAPAWRQESYQRIAESLGE